MRADQEFCISCGRKLTSGGAAASASAVPLQAKPQTRTQATSKPAQGISSQASGNFGQAQGKFSSFMGSDVDLSAVGQNFKAANISLEGVGREGIEAAFAYFGKSYRPAGDSSSVASPEIIKRREREREASAASMADLDYTLYSGGGDTNAYAQYASGLAGEYAPTISLITAKSNADAKTEEVKNRLKNQVAMDELKQTEAVEIAQGGAAHVIDAE